MSKMIIAFVRVVVYRTNKLWNQPRYLSRKYSIEIYHLKQRLDGLHGTIEVFDGHMPVRMISFLGTWRDTFDRVRVPGATVVRVMGYFLGRDAKDILSEQFSMTEVDFDVDSPNGIGKAIMTACGS